ncbi:MAG: AEC family transporter [Coriobacteriia bacterium]|nr:AEC family transporter [Coriobacteriia bacterium]
MSVAELLRVILGMLALVALGTVLRTVGLLKSDDARPINTVLIYVGLPALIFTTVQPAPVSWDLAEVPLMAWGFTLVAVLLAWVISRILRLPAPTAGAFILAAAFGNTGYIGYPLATALLGDTGLVRAIFYDVFGTVAAVLTVGIVVAGEMGEHQARVNPLKELFTFPPFIALLIALALRSVSVPVLVSDWLVDLSKIVVPLIMISVGLSLKPHGIRDRLGLVGGVAIIKLLVLPAVALLLGGLVVSDAGLVRLLVLQAGMPSMMLGLVIGMRFKLDVDFLASAILVTTVASVLTVPLMQLFT